MEFACVPGCGRSVVATRAYQPGDVVHEEDAYVMCAVNAAVAGGGGGGGRQSKKSPNGGMIPNQSTATNTNYGCCIGCFEIAKATKGASRTAITSGQDMAAGQVKTRCVRCDATYCSAACAASHEGKHVSSGECAVLAATAFVRSRIPKEDFNTFQVVCLSFAKAVSEGRAEALMRKLPTTPSGPVPQQDAAMTGLPVDIAAAHPQLAGGPTVGAAVAALQACDVETAGLGFEAPLRNFTESCVNQHPTTYEHMERLVTNRASIDPEIRRDYELLHRHYTRMQSMNKDAYWWSASLPPVSHDVFVSLCCAFQSNGFGLWSARGSGIATGFFPCSSFFNHSCAPNLGREMNGRRATFFAAKHIQPGEGLCLSYMDFKLPREDRRAKLKATYCFDCCCPRCSDPDAMDHRALYDVPLCHDCKSKILRPQLGTGETSAAVGVCPCCRQEYPLLL